MEGYTLVHDNPPQRRGRIRSEKSPHDTSYSSYQEGSHFILSIWIRNRYIKEKLLQNISPNSFIDSAQWNELLATKEVIGNFLECREDYQIVWRNGISNNKLGLIIEHIITKFHEDPISNGVWSNISSKYSIMLWRIKWKQLKIFII